MSLFSTLLTVMRKELRDLARDRRTLALTLLVGPLLYPILILGMSKLAESRVKTQIDKPLEIPTLGAENAPNLVRFLAAQGLTVVEPPEDLNAAIAAQDIDVAMRAANRLDASAAGGRTAPVGAWHRRPGGAPAECQHAGPCQPGGKARHGAVDAAAGPAHHHLVPWGGLPDHGRHRRRA